MNWNAVWTALDEAWRWTFTTSVEASVLIVAVVSIQTALRRHLPVRAQYLLGLLVLLRLVLPAVPSTTHDWTEGPQAPPDARSAPRSPRATITPSTASNIAGRSSMASGFSNFAIKSGMRLPAASLIIAERT